MTKFKIGNRVATDDGEKGVIESIAEHEFPDYLVFFDNGSRVSLSCIFIELDVEDTARLIKCLQDNKVPAQLSFDLLIQGFNLGMIKPLEDTLGDIK